jgi:plasmid stabilization system protein ParE
MRVECSKRALADLRQIAAYYARSGNSAIADGIAERIQQVIARITVSPLSGRTVVQRPGVRVVLPVVTRSSIGSRKALSGLCTSAIPPGGHTIKMANDTEFDLAAYFYSRDIDRIWRVAEGLE